MRDSLPDEVNISYWQSVLPDQVLAGVHMPGSELQRYITRDSLVLDFGCGAGAMIPYVEQFSAQYIGVDVNEQALKTITANHPKAVVYLTDGASALPMQDESIDVVIISYVLVSIVSDASLAVVVREIKRVLKPGGVVWLAEALVSPDYHSQYEQGKRLLGKEKIAVSLQPDGVVKRYIRHFTIEEISNLFAPLSVQYEAVVANTSPSSGKVVNTLVAIFKK